MSMLNKVLAGMVVLMMVASVAWATPRDAGSKIRGQQDYFEVPSAVQAYSAAAPSGQAESRAYSYEPAEAAAPCPCHGTKKAEPAPPAAPSAAAPRARRYSYEPAPSRSMPSYRSSSPAYLHANSKLLGKY